MATIVWRKVVAKIRKTEISEEIIWNENEKWRQSIENQRNEESYRRENNEMRKQLRSWAAKPSKTRKSKKESWKPAWPENGEESVAAEMAYGESLVTAASSAESNEESGNQLSEENCWNRRRRNWRRNEISKLAYRRSGLAKCENCCIVA